MQTLQSQLNLLQQKQKTAPKLPYGSHCSLLFDFRFSNKIELDTIYEIGYEGLLDLTRKDVVFTKYLKLLFSSTSKYFNRDMIPSSEIKEYDEHLRHLIYDLSKHFNSKSAHQVIEYLIKVYQVHLHLCDEIVLSFLCYHSQSVFTKLLQNINFAEHSLWNFIELYAKNGTLIPQTAIISYVNGDFAFLLRLISFYIDNIDLSNEVYYFFILDIIKAKIASMNTIKPIETNLFQLIIKVINKIHNGFSNIKMKKGELYTLAYVDLMIIALTKINFSMEYLQAIANDSIVKVMKSIIESKSSMIAMIKYHSLLCLKYTQLNHKEGKVNDARLYKTEALKAIEVNVSIISSVSDQLSLEKDIECFIYQLILSSEDQLSLVKSILASLFKEQSTIEQVILLLVKYNQTKYWSMIEDLNMALFNKAYISLFNQNLITAVIQTNRTNYGLYFDLISSSVSQVIKAIKECDEEMGIDIDESIKSALRSKFDFFNEEIILNSIMKMKRIPLDDLNESLLSFWYSILKGRVNKYSDALLQSIQRHLDKKELQSNQIYYLYRTVFFNDKDKGKEEGKRSVALEEILKALRDIIEYQPECNQKLNQKRLIAYIKEELASLSTTGVFLFQWKTIPSFFDSPKLLLFYPQIATTLYHSYISAIAKSKHLLEDDKLPLINYMVLYALNNPKNFTHQDIDEALGIVFGDKSSSSVSSKHQLYLAYLLFEEEKQSKETKVLEYVFNKLKTQTKTEIECLLLFALMMHLPQMSNDQISFYFNPKQKRTINYSSFNQLNSSSQCKESKWLISFKDQYIKGFQSLLALIYSNKNEIAINSNYLNRLFGSNSIDYEPLYLLVLNLLLNQYSQSYHKASMKVLSLFTKSVPFSKENQQSILSYVQSVNDSELESLLLQNFLLFYPKSQFEVMLFFKEKAIPPQLIDIFFENGFPVNEIKSPQILFQIVSFAIKNNVSPYMLNISFSQEELVQYLNYIIKNPIEESQLVYFFKMIMLMNNNSSSTSNNNAELISKTIEVMKANCNEDININLCYAIYSFSKQLIKAKAPNDISDIIKSIESLFIRLCSSITLSNLINYEQEKKIQLLLSASNHLCSISSIDNNILIHLSQYVDNCDSLGIVLKKEISSIILESIIDFIDLIDKKSKKQLPEFYFKYIECVIHYSEITDQFLKQLSQNDIMRIHQCEAFFAYNLYEKYANIERNEILTGFILTERDVSDKDNDNNQSRTMFEWMKLIEEVLNLKETKDKTIKDLIGYILSFILKIRKWTLIEMSDQSSNSIRKKDTCTIILNIVTLLYPNSNDLIEKLLQFSKKNKLLSTLLIALYSPNEAKAINYSKGKNYTLSKLTQLIPIESSDYHYELLSFVLKIVIINGKEKKIENLIYLYQLLTRITNKKMPGDLLKECLNKIIQEIVFKKSNLGQIVYLLTICKWLLTVFNQFTMSYVTSLNDFIPLFIQVINEAFAFGYNNNIKSLLVDNMELLTNEVCVYLSPFLNDLIQALIQFEDIEEAKGVLIKIGSKNIFDSSFQCVKSNWSKTNSLLLIYFNSAIHSADGLIIADLGDEVMDFFVSLLLIHQKFYNQIRECIKSFILKIHGKQLKIIFQELLKRLKTKDEYQEYQLNNSIVIFQVFNSILSIIKDLFIKNYFMKYKDIVIQLLNTSNAFIFKKSTVVSKLGQKRERSLDNDEDDTSNDFTYYKLSCLLLENIKMNFKYSKGELLSETTEEFYEPVLNQLKLSDSMNEMIKYYEEVVKGCLYEMFKNLKSDELIGKFNEDLLDLLREDNHVTRLLVLKTVIYLFETMKERYISFIEEIVQYVSERLEDSNDLVQNAAREAIKCIEKLTGESYAAYLE